MQCVESVNVVPAKKPRSGFYLGQDERPLTSYGPEL